MYSPFLNLPLIAFFTLRLVFFACHSLTMFLNGAMSLSSPYRVNAVMDCDVPYALARKIKLRVLPCEDIVPAKP